MITVKEGIVKIKTTYETSPNIALVKYWGKFDEDHLLPLNSSTGITLSTEDLQTRTTLVLSNKYTEMKFLLNGEPHPVSGRLKKILSFFEKEALPGLGDIQITTSEGVKKSLKECLVNGDLSTLKLKIKSVNSFPTASGLASSASGLAALSVCLFEVYHFKE
jgi:diphosphomevalonate decarboxylase